MKRIGLIGGMSWESTLPYYRLVNQEVNRGLGGLHSAEILLFSLDFQPFEELQHEGRWEEAGRRLAQAALILEKGGADFLVLCTNTMHRVAPRIERSLTIPLLHIADPTAEAIREAGLQRVGLLGTRFTMEQDFYKRRLADRHGLEVAIPEAEDRQLAHRIIYDELCRGIVREESRREYQRIIEALLGKGAQGVVLGCTEISLLVRAEALQAPIFDTTELHAKQAARLALGE